MHTDDPSPQARPAPAVPTDAATRSEPASVPGDEGGNRRGRYVVVEGGEGVGKTTQVTLLVERLRSEGIACEQVREPGGDPFAEAGRQLLLSDLERTPAAEVFAFNALRAQLLESVVAPLLASGTWVLADRGRLSTIAYQGHGSGADLAWTRAVCDLGVSVCPPDLEVVLDLDPVVAAERRTVRGDDDRFERMDLAFHQRVADAYRSEAALAGITVVDADGTPEQVAARLWEIVAPLR
jgi:dTMP kinase